VLGHSEDRKKVFREIYRGKKKIKTVAEIADATGLQRKRVLEEANKLSSNDIITKVTNENGLCYEKFPFYTQNKEKVLKMAGNEKAQAKLHTKYNPQIDMPNIKVKLPKNMINIELITVDDIDSFSNVRGIAFSQNPMPIYEGKFKDGLKKILNEEGEFQDWGGEIDDLFSTRLVIKGERIVAAFGLKGRGMTGKLTPKNMGKRGDQIQRLFKAPAEVFIIQYWNQIDESVVDLMRSLAQAKSATEGKKIFYCIIDGQDTSRIILAYPDYFSL
jgi:hypothetical protein